LIFGQNGRGSSKLRKKTKTIKRIKIKTKLLGKARELLG
jgi:hypothetical protein